MEAQSFGHKHTVRKLETVQRYLQTYATALKYQPFELLYVDACAGSGSSVPKGTLELTETGQVSLEGLAPPVADTDEIIVGSAVRALGVTPPFHKYLLNDVKRSNVDALRKAVREDFPHLTERVELTRLDANEMLRNLCRSQNWKETRAVVFLDPFGLQINYETLELLGRTQAVDLWYLVPVFAMYRQVSGEGQINPDGGPAWMPRSVQTLGETLRLLKSDRPTSLINLNFARNERWILLGLRRSRKSAWATLLEEGSWTKHYLLEETASKNFRLCSRGLTPERRRSSLPNLQRQCWRNGWHLGN